MFSREKIREEYFIWLIDSISLGKYKSKRRQFEKVLKRLYEREFTYINPHDFNRAQDGIECRWHYASLTGQKEDFDILELCLGGPCTILEMMVALSDKCYCLMGEDYSEDRSFWFWSMMDNLGLTVNKTQWSNDYVDLILDDFLERRYEPNGRGSLFLIRDTKGKDMRDVEIWYQMCAYLNEIS